MDGSNEQIASSSNINPTINIAPPPPPPLPGTPGALNVPTYKETKKQNDLAKAMETTQFANLPDKLMNTMKREKKPFTYTPLSVGDNGKLDLTQIKSPKMKKRLLANMKDENDEPEENKIESIDSSLQNYKSQDKLDQELTTSPIQLKPAKNLIAKNIEPCYTPTSSIKPTLVVPLSVLQEETDQFTKSASPPPLPLRQTSLNYDMERPLSPVEKLNNLLNEQLSRNASPNMNNYNSSNYYDQKYDDSDNNKQFYGLSKPKKINIAKELNDERNFNTVTSQYSSPNFNSAPKQWSSNTKIHPIKVETDFRPQSQNSYDFNNNIQPSYSPKIYNNLINQNNYQEIPISSLNKNSPPLPPQRQQSLNRVSYDETEGKKIPIEYEREEPIQSKSFKILQKLTAGIEDELEKLKFVNNKSSNFVKCSTDDNLPPYFGTLNHIEQPRIRSERRIPIQVDKESEKNFYQPEYHPRNEQNWINSNYSNQQSTSNQNAYWTESEWTPKIPASEQIQITPPPRYQGSNIPSRTFRILQMMTGEDVNYY